MTLGRAADGQAAFKAAEIVKGLMWFALLRSPDPEKQKLLTRLTELRIEVQDLFDKLTPGYLE